MIQGYVQNQRAIVELLVVRETGQQIKIPFVLDTGYSGTLALPNTVCAEMGLRFRRSGAANLADGTPVQLNIYVATILWEGELRRFELYGLDDDPLLGMTALEGYRVCLDIVEDGLVKIEAL